MNEALAAAIVGAPSTRTPPGGPAPAPRGGEPASPGRGGEGAGGASSRRGRRWRARCARRCT
eukprot:5150943-Pleurochrysis_carterae.AAC.2